MLQATKFLAQIYNNLEKSFLYTKEDYRYYFFFPKKNISFVNIEALQCKNNTLAAFKNYKSYVKSNLVVNLKFFIQIGEESI